MNFCGWQYLELIKQESIADATLLLTHIAASAEHAGHIGDWVRDDIASAQIAKGSKVKPSASLKNLMF